MAVEQMAKFLGNLNHRFRNILWLKQGTCKLSVLNIEKQKKPLCLKKKKLYERSISMIKAEEGKRAVAII